MNAVRQLSAKPVRFRLTLRKCLCRYCEHEAGIQIIAISYDAVPELTKFAEKRQITFPLLSDPESKTISAFDLMNKEAKGKSEGVPYPGTFILDKDGVIGAKLFHDGYAKRHTPEDLLKAAKEVK